MRLGCFPVVLLMVAGIASAVWLIGSSPIPEFLSGDAPLLGEPDPAGGKGRANDSGAQAPSGNGRPRGNSADQDEGLGEQILKVLEDAPGVIWRAIRIPLAVLAVVALILLLMRWLARRKRQYVRLGFLPYRSELVEPEEVRRMIEVWHQQLLRRWWHRLPYGQQSIALEVVSAPDHNEELEGRLSVVCPERLAEAVEGTLLGCYEDCTVTRAPAPPPSARTSSA